MVSVADQGAAGRNDSAYRAVLEQLYSARRSGIRWGLERIARCLERLGHPEERCRAVVQIGGTNGKGSTSRFCEQVLSEHGVRVGRFSSPHLSSLTERFSICGHAVSRAEVVCAHGAVLAAGGEEMTFFEQVTAMAAWIFASAGVEVALMEVGLGGRLDSTSAIAAAVAAVTGVAIDHTEYLGTTLAEIAAEKGAIFRNGRPAVIGLSGEAAGAQLLKDVALERGAAPICQVGDRELALVPDRLAMAGGFQRFNAASAVAILDCLAAGGAIGTIAPATLARGLRTARLAGRLETVAERPTVIVDGAHNVQAAHTLAGELADGCVLVLGVSRGKDAAGIAAALGRRCPTVVVTQSRADRAMPRSELAAEVARALPSAEVVCAEDAAHALAIARVRAGVGGVVAVAGSLFLVAEVREHEGLAGPDPVVLTDPGGKFARAQAST